MKLRSPMLVAKDIDKSVAFYKKVLNLDVVTDFGANKVLTGGLSLQTEQTYRKFIGAKPISYGGNDFEIYFEEDDFDAFIEKLAKCNVNLVHPVVEHSWGQRVVRFYDPDGHIVEVGENMQSVCRRFVASGLTVEQVAKKMDVPVDYVRANVQ